MSLEGKAAGKLLKGRINSVDTLILDAYAIAVKNGFEGTEEEWLASLKGEKGDKGDIGYVEGDPITAEMVHARPDTWMPTAADVGARPDTWLPTIAEIGAAPAGYGLGEKVGRYCADCYSGTQLGLYYVDGNTANMPNGATGGVLLVEGKSTTYNYGVDFYLTLKSGVEIWHCYYSSWAGQWQPWECENPPMELGKEYRTTERWQGKAVYTKQVSVGNLPNATTKTIENVVTDGFSDLVDLTYSIYAGATKRITDSRVSMNISASGGSASLVITATENVSGYAGFVTLKYTKD